MREAGCIELLKWGLPQLGLAWPGFRRVHRQVCKRVGRRLAELHLSDVLDYRDFLQSHPEEWPVFNSFCRISISRFYRDQPVFDYLGKAILPELAANALADSQCELRSCSLGCAAGEEPYSLNLLWKFSIAPRFPTLALRIVAVDADEQMLERAQIACFQRSSLKELPADWINSAFTHSGNQHCLKAEFRTGIEFHLKDILEIMPSGPFDLILCRNVVFTYFAMPSQSRSLDQMLGELKDEGALVIGRKESLPPSETSFQPWRSELGIYRKPASDRE